MCPSVRRRKIDKGRKPLGCSCFSHLEKSDDRAGHSATPLRESLQRLWTHSSSLVMNPHTPRKQRGTMLGAAAVKNSFKYQIRLASRALRLSVSYVALGVLVG